MGRVASGVDMRTRVRNPFTTVQTSGLLLPVDLLARIVDGDPSLPGLTPDSYHLNAGERLNEAAARAWNTCVGNWKAFREASRKVPASDQGTTLTRDKWLLPLFRELGYGWLQANKRSLEIDGKPYPVSHQWQSHVPVHLVSFKFDIDRRTPGATGAAQRSPYSLVQEFLNRSAQHRWGFVSNGLKLVVLHDNVSLVRASNVEFDLEAMFEGEVYPDFFLLFSLCHQSRVEILAEEQPEECWLERWSKLAEEQGTRAREKLRVGVERAIQALGTGFRTAQRKHRSQRGPADGDARHAGVLPRAAPDGLPASCCCSWPRTSGWARTRTSSIPRTQRPRPAAAMPSITRSDDSGSSRRSDAGRPTPTSTSRSRSSSRSCGLGMPLSRSPASARSCSRPRRPRTSMQHLLPTSTCSKRSVTSATPRTSRDAVAPCCGRWTSATWDRRSWARSTSRSSSCTLASTLTRGPSSWP